MEIHVFSNMKPTFGLCDLGFMFLFQVFSFLLKLCKFDSYRKTFKYKFQWFHVSVSNVDVRSENKGRERRGESKCLS